jgi:hypothetical protein
VYARQRVQPTGTNRPRAWINKVLRARYGVLEGPPHRFDVALRQQVFGGHSGGVTPVPIPNTEVKPTSADGTWEETPRESRTPPDFSRRRGSHREPLRRFRWSCRHRRVQSPNGRSPLRIVAFGRQGPAGLGSQEVDAGGRRRPRRRRVTPVTPVGQQFAGRQAGGQQFAGRQAGGQQFAGRQAGGCLGRSGERVVVAQLVEAWRCPGPGPEGPWPERAPSIGAGARGARGAGLVGGGCPQGRRAGRRTAGEGRRPRERAHHDG